MTGIGCRYCSGFSVIPGENDLQTLDSEMASEWHPDKNGNVIPRDAKINSNKRVWWLCEKGHEWEVAVSDRGQYGTGCPFCSHSQPWSVAEKEVHASVVATFPELEIHENYRNKHLGPFELDIYVQDIQLGIEFNGEYWHDESRDPRIKNRHERKQAICDTYNVRLAIVWENDWNERQDEVEEQIVQIVAGGNSCLADI